MPGYIKQKDTLYVKLPIAIKDKLTIKNLHPDIEDVRIPRQKRARFCTIKFTDLEKCEKVKNDLHEKTIDGKRILVSYGLKKRFKSEKQCVKLILMKLPDNVHKKDIKKIIPKAAKIKIKRANKIRKFTWALLLFESQSDAMEIASKETLNIKNVDVKVEYYIKTKNEQPKNVIDNKLKKEFIDNSKSKDEKMTLRYFQVTL